MLMAENDELVAALVRALEIDPGASRLRVHLVTVLLDAGMAEQAWPHCQVLLGAAPDDVEVLGLASRVATATGRGSEAAAYERLRGLVSQSSAAPAPLAQSDVPEPFGDAADVFLREVLREHAERHVTLSDVGGLDAVKRRLEMSFLGPLRNPELRAAYGKSLRGGLLLWGPPGCGKTFLARAIAGELGATFISVGVHEVLDMWVGSSERNLHAIFEAARRSRPAVVFFDELDAIGHSRTRQATGAMRNVVATLLTELDGLGSDNESIFVLAATNQPWDVDPALRRPGRFDRTLAVLPPDESAREAILEVNLRNRPTDRVDLRRIAAMTDGYSGADLRLVCETALERALESATRSGRLEPVTSSLLEQAVREVKPSVGAWIESAKNFVAYANEDGAYDELAEYLRARKGRRSR